MANRSKFIVEDNGPQLEVFLNSIITDTEEGAKAFLQESNKFMKQSLKGHMPRSEYNEDGHVHMQDDINTSIKKDEDGGMYSSIRGGKKTGTLWHLVNDGTYRTQGSHFMDKALNDYDGQMNTIADTALKKLGD